MRDGLGDSLHVGVGGKGLDLLDDGAKGERQVGTRVAVGHGEYVELVDLLGLVGDDLRRDGETGLDDGSNQVLGPRSVMVRLVCVGC